VEDVLVTYIKDWLKLTVEVDAVDMVKDFCNIYCRHVNTPTELKVYFQNGRR